MGNFLSGARAVAQSNGPELELPTDLAADLVPYWNLVVAQLPAGIATAHETQAVLQLCQALHVRDRAYQQILDGGIETVDNTHGGEKRRNPAIITWRQAADMVVQLMNMLGMSPVSRARIQAADTERADPIMDYLRRRNGAAQSD